MASASHHPPIYGTVSEQTDVEQLCNVAYTMVLAYREWAKLKRHHFTFFLGTDEWICTIL